MSTRQEWFERIEFTYLNADGDVVTRTIEREEGIPRHTAEECFELFMLSCGYIEFDDDVEDAVTIRIAGDYGGNGGDY